MQNKKMVLKNNIGKAINVILFIIAIALSSCSNKICSSYGRSEDRIYSRQKYRPSATGIPSPLNTARKAILEKKYLQNR
jgi:hypothetical protein